MKKFDKNYFIGLDLGTNSVGWTAIDETFSVIKLRGKHLWGAVLFDEAKSAKDRRVKRSQRRRFERRKERIRLLQSLVEGDVNKKDANFFPRLEVSFLQNVKNDTEFGRDNFYNLFDGDYTDKDYYKEYPTIYHLRKALISENRQFDIRLVYLAVHHIIKYRGNFLHEEENIDINPGELKNDLNDIIYLYSVALSDEDGITDTIFNQIDTEKAIGILTDKSKKRSAKQAELLELVSEKDAKARWKEFINLLLGFQTKLDVLFNITAEDGQNKNDYKVSFDATDYEEKSENFEKLFGEDCTSVISKMHSLYLNLVFSDIMYGEKFISFAMVNKYQKHGTDLKVLKAMLNANRENPDVIAFKKVFKKANLANKDKLESIIKEVNKLLKILPDSEEKSYIEESLKNGDFLEKLNSTKNAAIPYQMNKTELEIILNNQAVFYPTLAENKDKIISLLTFRRPYSVGIIKSDSPFSWIKQEIHERVYPWNFEELVDYEKAAEAFMEKSLSGSYCTYFHDERVLPKNSVLYQKFNVLNELSNISYKESDKNYWVRLSVPQKQHIFDSLFLEKNTVSLEDVRQELQNKFNVKIAKGDIRGTSDQKKFTSSMKVCRNLKRILGKDPFDNVDEADKIITDLTVFNDAKILKNRFKKYGLNDSQIKELLHLNISGWGNLSKKVIYGIKSNSDTILETLYTTEKNFMEIINDDSLAFKEQIFTKVDTDVDNNLSDIIDDLYASPSVKRTIRQAVKVVKEVTKILGKQPIGIYLESTRRATDKKRTKSRSEKLRDIYHAIETDVDLYNSEIAYNGEIVACLKNGKITDEMLESDMVYLYCLQMGKSMYSGAPLDLAHLSETCEIDHIVPRCYIKDDSLDNRVLVLKHENQEKSGTLALTDKIINKMKPRWEAMCRAKLISRRKLSNLLKREYSDSDRQKFINRQLVETNQSIKCVRDLFKSIYPNADVEMVKAGISTEFRHSMISDGYDSFYKLRALNDMHHAKDAYLAGVIAYFTRKIYPIWGATDEARTLKWELSKNYGSARELVNRRFGIVVDAMRYKTPDAAVLERNNLDWNTCYNNILRCFDYNDCLITKKRESEANAAFSKETIISPEKKDGSLPLRYIKDRNGNLRPLPVEKYGNYTNEYCQYFVNLTYPKGKKIISAFLGVPVRVAYMEKQDKNAVINYFAGLLNVSAESITIDKRIIERFQLIRYKGQLCYIASDSYLWNAVQLVVDKKYNELLYLVTHKSNNVTVKGGTVVNLKKQKTYDNGLIDGFIEHYLEKLSKHYPLYSRYIEQIKTYTASDAFKNLPLVSEDNIDKCEYVSRLLRLTSATSTQLDMKNFGGKSGFGKLENMKVIKDNVDWIDQSITGFYVSTIKSKGDN